MHEDTRHRVNWYLNALVVVLVFSIPIYRRWVPAAEALIFVLWLVEGRWTEKFAILKRHWLSLAVVGFIAFNLLSLAWSDYPGEGLDYLGKYRHLLLIPIIATSLRHRFRGWAESAFLVGTALSLVASYSIFFGLFRLRDAYSGNPSPTMSHLDYSMVLAVAASIVLSRLLEGDLPPRRATMMTALLIFIAGGLAINIGRSGQAAFVMSTIVLIPLVLWPKSPRAAVISVIAALTILATAYAAVSPLNVRVDKGIDELVNALAEQDYGSNQGMRVAGAMVAFEVFKEDPLLGTGVGGNMHRFQELLDSRLPTLKPEISWFPHFHNQYLQTVTEIGLIGLILLFTIFCALWLGPYIDPHDRHVAVILGVTYLIGFFGDPFLHKQLPLVLFATMAGLISANGRSLAWKAQG